MIALILLLLLLTSCMKTEVLNAPIEQMDTVMYRKPHKPFPPKDTTDQDDRVPITFSPSVEDWEEQDINI